MLFSFSRLCLAFLVFGLFAGKASAECSVDAPENCGPDDLARIERDLKVELDRSDDPLVLFALGRFYRTAAAPHRNPELAITYFEQAVNAGEPWSMLALGEMLGKGEGTAVDRKRAEALLNDAANSGLNGPALFALGNLRLQSGSPDEAIAYFERAADAGEPWALLALANMLEKGKGTPADSKQAKELRYRALNDHHLNYSYVDLIFSAIRNYTQPDSVQKTLDLLKITHDVDPNLSRNALLWLQPNQKVAVIQGILGIENIYAGNLDGLLTKSTLHAIGDFCRQRGISSECRKEAMPPALLDALLTYLVDRNRTA